MLPDKSVVKASLKHATILWISDYSENIGQLDKSPAEKLSVIVKNGGCGELAFSRQVQNDRYMILRELLGLISPTEHNLFCKAKVNIHTKDERLLEAVGRDLKFAIAYDLEGNFIKQAKPCDITVLHCEFQDSAQISKALNAIDTDTPETLVCIVASSNAKLPAMELKLNVKQSYQFFDGTELKSAEDVSGFFVYSHPYAVRRDGCQRLSFDDIRKHGCNGRIQAVHLLREIAYKLELTPKYGA